MSKLILQPKEKNTILFRMEKSEYAVTVVYLKETPNIMKIPYFTGIDYQEITNSDQANFL